MAIYNSSEVSLHAPAESVFSKLSNLENLRTLLDKVPAEQIPADKRAPIQEAVAKLKEAHKNSDLAGIEAAIKDIERTFGAAQQDILNAQAQAQQAAGGAQGYANPGASAGNQGDDHVTDVDFEEVK